MWHKTGKWIFKESKCYGCGKIVHFTYHCKEITEDIVNIKERKKTNEKSFSIWEKETVFGKILMS